MEARRELFDVSRTSVAISTKAAAPTTAPSSGPACARRVAGTAPSTSPGSHVPWACAASRGRAIAFNPPTATPIIPSHPAVSPGCLRPGVPARSGWPTTPPWTPDLRKMPCHGVHASTPRPLFRCEPTPTTQACPRGWGHGRNPRGDGNRSRQGLDGFDHDHATSPPARVAILLATDDNLPGPAPLQVEGGILRNKKRESSLILSEAFKLVSPGGLRAHGINHDALPHDLPWPVTGEDDFGLSPRDGRRRNQILRRGGLLNRNRNRNGCLRGRRQGRRGLQRDRSPAKRRRGRGCRRSSAGSYQRPSGNKRRGGNGPPGTRRRAAGGRWQRYLRGCHGLGRGGGGLPAGRPCIPRLARDCPGRGRGAGIHETAHRTLRGGNPRPSVQLGGNLDVGTARQVPHLGEVGAGTCPKVGPVHPYLSGNRVNKARGNPNTRRRRRRQLDPTHRIGGPRRRGGTPGRQGVASLPLLESCEDLRVHGWTRPEAGVFRDEDPRSLGPRHG